MQYHQTTSPLGFSNHSNWRILLVCGLLGVCAMLGCKHSDSEAGPGGGGDGGRPTPTVQVALAEKQTVTDYVELVGHTTADQIVDIRARVSGFLLKRHFQDGQRVKQGEVLFSIQPEQFEAVYEQSLAQIQINKAKVDLAEKTLARTAKLLEQNAVSRQEYDQNVAELATARAQVVAAQADAARTKLDVEYTKIFSPVDGRVDNHLIDEGNYITGGILGGTVLTTVVDDTPIKAEAHIDEVALLNIMRRYRKKAGAEDGKYQEADVISDYNIPCYLQLSDEDDFPHEGKLEFVQRVVNKGTGTAMVRGVFDNSQLLFRVGMFIRMKIPMSDPYEAVLVPDRAIGTDQASRFLYIVDDKGVVQQKTVELGDLKGKMRIVKSGVKPGDQVISVGLQLVQPGMTVKTKQYEEGGGSKEEKGHSHSDDQSHDHDASGGGDQSDGDASKKSSDAS